MIAAASIAAVLATCGAAHGQQKLEVFLPAGRTAYQTNETIPVCVLRQGEGALPAGELELTLAGADGGRATARFALAAVEGAPARRTEHFYLNGWLLRPGRYALTARAGEAQAEAAIEVRAHVRASDFVTLAWGSRASGVPLEAMGEDALGFNVVMATLPDDHSVRAGVDWTGCCTMGGGHQLNLRLECDWSDPYSIRGGAGANAAQTAVSYSFSPNAIGVHFYDEPGLTWHTHPETGEMTPHDVPAQLRSYRSAFGKEMIPHNKIDPENPEHFAAWQHWGRWKLSFMEAAWRLSRFAVEWVSPELLSFTQSQYGWRAYTDGYYFNVVRSLPIISGHGGYDDLPAGYWCPSFFYEMGRAREYGKDAWYLPGWYNNLTPDRFRLEQYLTFMMNVQGLATPPWLEIHHPSTVWAADGIVESNKLLLKLGPVMKTVRATPTGAAMLWSISQNLYAQSRDMKDNYGGGEHQDKLNYVYLAGKLLATSILPVVEEDVLDGTVAATCKVLVLAGIDYLDPRVVAGLEGFIRRGGTVLVTPESKVEISGAQRLTAKAENRNADKFPPLMAARNWQELRKYQSAGEMLASAEPLARELKAHFDRAGLTPAFLTDDPQVAGAVQAAGEVDYVFAVNAGYDDVFADGPERHHAIRTAAATIRLPADGRAVYDALASGPAPFQKLGDELVAKLRFGPGQMRVFARTARPIGNVKAAAPILRRDLTRDRAPLAVEVGAVVLDDRGGVLAGSVPLEVTVTDPLGATRYHLYRSTDQGIWRLALPLAANDPAGAWTVKVRDLLAGTEDSATFAYAPAGDCGALAGAARRAIVLDAQRENIYRFFRVHRKVQIVTGGSDYNAPAAQRLAEALKPWDVACTITTAEAVNRPRPISEEEAPTWSGPGHTGRGLIKPGDKNPIPHVGYDVEAAVILLGTPEDNPLIKSLTGRHGHGGSLLPYEPKAGRFPGPGRGMVAWQRDAVGFERDSIALVAHDAEGMAEAVGTLYEICAGLAPLTRWVQPDANEVAPARAAEAAPAAAVAWQTALPDRVLDLRALPAGLLVLANDGTVARLDAKGAAAWSRTFDGGEFWSLDASTDGALVAVNTMHQVHLLDGAGKDIAAVDLRRAELGAGVKAVAVAPDGSCVLVNGRDGSLARLDAKGKQVWKTETLTRAALDAHAKALAEWEAGAAQRKAEMDAWKAAHDKWQAEKGKKEDEPARPKQAPRPEAPRAVLYHRLAFAPGGQLVLGIASGEVHVIDPADGAVKARIGGFAAVKGADATACRIVPAGEDLVLTDAAAAVMRFSPAEGKVVAKLPTAKLPAAAAGMGDGVLVATDSDHTLRRFRAWAGKPDEITAWEYRAPGRAPKFVLPRGARLAVGFWGGTVQVLDEAGRLGLANAFDQDVAALAWLDDATLAVGLADGRVVALTVK